MYPLVLQTVGSFPKHCVCLLVNSIIRLQVQEDFLEVAMKLCGTSYDEKGYEYQIKSPKNSLDISECGIF